MSSVRAAREAPRFAPEPRAGSSEALTWAKLLVPFVVVCWMASAAVGLEMALTFLTLGSFGVACLGFWKPSVGLIGVTMLCTMDPLSRQFVEAWGLWRWSTFTYFLVALAILYGSRSRSIGALPSRCLAALVVVLVVGMAWSSNRPDAITHTLGAVSFWGLLVAVERAGTKPSTWFAAALVSGTIGACGGFIFFIQATSLKKLINPNAFAHFPLAALFVCCIALWMGVGSKMKEAMVAGLGACNALWIFLSASRGGSVLALICVIFLVLSMRSSVTRLGFLAMALVIGSWAATRFGDRQDLFEHRVNKLFDSGSSLSGRTSGRSDLALGGWNLFLAHPVTGVGTANFARSWSKLSELKGASAFKLGAEAAAHSGWIKVMAENGGPGLLALIAFVCSFIVLGWKARRGGGLRLGILATLGVGAALLSTEFQSKDVWMLAAAATALLTLRIEAMKVRPARKPSPGARFAGA